MSEEEKPGWSGLEKHVQSGIAVILLALLAWNWSTTQDMSVRFAVMENQMNTLSGQFMSLNENTKDRYTSKQAEQDKAQLWREIDRMDLRLHDLEERLMDE